MTSVIRIGDRVLFDEAEHEVAAISGTTVRLVSAAGGATVVSLVHLVASQGFRLLSDRQIQVRAGGLVGQSLDDLPPAEAQLARFWEQHLIELETGLRPGCDESAAPRPEYDPARPIAPNPAGPVAQRIYWPRRNRDPVADWIDGLTRTHIDWKRTALPRRLSRPL
ncbi:hypothetical protein [Nocardia brasiliensis]|uniref:hypothetical protein n=1 Tax=Nocardia brasiliensis TaxID=37326 RepID=UPI00366FD3F8